MLRDNYSYIVTAADSNDALIVDPTIPEPIIAACERLSLKPQAILNTHHHWDHSDGNRVLKAHYNTHVVAQDSKRTPCTDTPPQPHLSIAGLEIDVITTPGHTLDHVAYCIGDALFCGDTLFGAGCGRLFEGTAAQMWASLKTLAGLPSDTKVYCAHEYTLANLRFARQVDENNEALHARCQRDKQQRRAGRPTVPSSIAVERSTNPFLRPLNGDFRRHYAKRWSIPDDELSVFSHLRHSKDQA